MEQVSAEVSEKVLAAEGARQLQEEGEGEEDD